MIWLFRVLSILSIGVAIVFGMSEFRWKARLTVSNHSWIIDVGAYPTNFTPLLPCFEDFAAKFDELPPADAPGLSIRLVREWEWTMIVTLFHLWWTTWLITLAYWMFRRQRRDAFFQAIAGAALGLTAGAALCIGSWLLIGGWGPPFPIVFGLHGLAVGVVIALVAHCVRRATDPMYGRYGPY